MNKKQILGVTILIVGVVLIFISRYIMGQVEEGNRKISSAKKTVEQGNSLFSMNPVSKEIGKGLTSGAEHKIRSGEEEIAYYTSLAKICKIGGILLIITGAGVVLFCRKR